MHATQQTTLHLPGPQAADVLGVSLRTLQRLAARGEIRRDVFGRRTLYAVNPRHDTDDTRHNPRHSDATPAPKSVSPAPPAPPVTRQPDDTPAALVALARMVATAELERDQTRLELAAARARIAELEAIAGQLAETCKARHRRIVALLNQGR